MVSVHLRHPANQRFALIIGLSVFVVLAFRSSFVSMWDLWQTSDHRHGILVFPISAFLIWRVRRELADVHLQVDARGLFLLVPVSICWIVARLAGIQVAEHILAIGMIPAALASLAGLEVVRKILFPLVFMFFATPLGDSLVPSLMLITANISTALLKLSGFPLLRDGQYISLPGGEFVVADVCAGLRYLSAGLMIVMLYGYLTYESIRKRLLLIIVTAFTLVAANGIRAYIVMAVASATQMEYLGGRDHIYFGWLLFGIVMMAIMWIGTWFADKGALPAQDPSDTTIMHVSHSMLPMIAALGLVMLAITVIPLQADLSEASTMLAAAVALLVIAYFLLRRIPGQESTFHEEEAVVALHFGWKRIATGLAGIAVLLLTPRFAASIEDESVFPAGQLDLVRATSCAMGGDWRAPMLPTFDNASIEQSYTLHCDQRPVGIYAASFSSALQGAELISSSHFVTPPEWDRSATMSSATLPSGVNVGEIEIDLPDYKALVWFWYEVDGSVSTSASRTKLNQLVALMKRRPAGGSIVVLETDVSDGKGAARERLTGVAENLIAEQRMVASGA